MLNFFFNRTLFKKDIGCFQNYYYTDTEAKKNSMFSNIF